MDFFSSSLLAGLQSLPHLSTAANSRSLLHTQYSSLRLGKLMTGKSADSMLGGGALTALSSAQGSERNVS